MTTGSLTISIEVELGWGTHNIQRYDHLSSDGSEERRYLNRLLDACDTHSVPITFDAVGHLFYDECDGHHPGPYPDNWFDEDPGTDAETDPLFYAPDIIDAIEERNRHELCTHTFSHVLADELPGEAICFDIETAQDIHEEHLGRRAKSYVPPNHQTPKYDILQQHGIRSIRAPSDTSDRSQVSRFKELLFGPPVMRDPEIKDDVVETYCTTYPSLTASSLPAGQRTTHPSFRWLPVRTRQRLHQRYLRRTLRIGMNEGRNVHFWCHLYDLSNEFQWPVIEKFLEHTARMVEDGRLEVLTMEDVDQKLRDGEEI